MRYQQQPTLSPFGLLRYARRRRHRRVHRKILSSLTALLCLMILFLFSQWYEDGGLPTPSSPTHSETPGQMKVHYLDVGQGAAVLAECDGHFMLIDGGDRSASSFVVSYLEQLGITFLDIVLISHYDADHLNGVVGALNSFDCGTIICPDYEAETKLYQSFLSIVNEKDIPLIHPVIGDQFTLGSASFSVVAPVHYDYKDANDNSIGIRLANGNDSFLFTGDAEAESEEDFCALPTDLSCDVYYAGHHGSSSSSTWSLLEKALPEYVVISCGADNSYGHPHSETMEKMEAIGAMVFRTDTQGTILAVSEGNGIQWQQEPFHDFSN